LASRPAAVQEEPMPHIELPEGAPGITGPLRAYPDTAVHLNGLADALLRGPSSLSAAERELIAAFVSQGNVCGFCLQAHAATARELYGAECGIVDGALRDPAVAPVSEKLRRLLAIAEKVRRDGRLVTDADVAEARAAGADDRAIHDTVLIAAAFCMFNRYVDGLATATPADPAVYARIGQVLAAVGYAGALGA
jgi:uncharacterized peroxidase-related enzyme